MNETTAAGHPSELAFRESNGLEVALWWDRRDGSVTVTVVDCRNGDAVVIDAPLDRALDVFNHPFAYAAPARVDVEEPLLAA